METKLQGMKTWSDIDETQDGLMLIKLLRDITHKRDETAQAMLDVVRADKELMLCIQSEHMSLTSYLVEFKQPEWRSSKALAESQAYTTQR